jgi:hypothetical protein
MPLKPLSFNSSIEDGSAVRSGCQAAMGIRFFIFVDSSHILSVSTWWDFVATLLMMEISTPALLMDHRSPFIEPSQWQGIFARLEILGIRLCAISSGNTCV